MRLKKLELRNFKGVDDYALAPEGKSISIFGANATGKTTLMDALWWLLFDKDSLNRTDFEIKKLSAVGEPTHNLEHGVEGVFEVDGEDLTLQKIYTEKWVKKRGASRREFTGHITRYSIDGVPAKKKEFTAKVAEICDENLFKLLTNPKHFNEQMHWQDRRNLLLDVCGDITDADVVASDDALAGLPSILGKRSIDDHRKVIKSRLSEINKEIDRIPVRIDEVSGQKITDLPTMEDVEGALATAKKGKEDAEQKKSEIEAGGMDGVLTTRIREIDNEIGRIDNERLSEEAGARRKELEIVGELSKKVQSASMSLDKAQTEYSRLSNRTKEINGSLERLKEQMEALREKWHEVDVEKMAPYTETASCPTCGQAIPKEQVDAARAKAEAAFNADKAKRLEDITREGKGKKTRREELAKELLDINEAMLTADSVVATAKDQLAEAEKALADHKEAVKNKVEPQESKEKEALLEERSEIEKKLADKKGSIADELKVVEKEIEALAQEIESNERLKLNHESNDRINARVEELEAKEKSLAAEYEKLESELHLTELFIRAKVTLLESKIAAKFRIARFKMFEEQINEGLRETCVATLNGVPYGSMNSAGRIQVGVDICETLADHYGKIMPIWIDNAESVTDIPATEAQQVRLVVSADDDVLRVA